jgi:hypothetical protein
MWRPPASSVYQSGRGRPERGHRRDRLPAGEFLNVAGDRIVQEKGKYGIDRFNPHFLVHFFQQAMLWSTLSLTERKDMIRRSFRIGQRNRERVPDFADMREDGDTIFSSISAVYSLNFSLTSKDIRRHVPIQV